MALELLSGPNVVYNPDTGAELVVQSSAPDAIWVDPRGIVMDVVNVGRVVVQMDGAAYVSGQQRRLDTQLFQVDRALVVRGGSSGNPYAGERAVGSFEATLSTAARVWAFNKITLVEDDEQTDNAPPLGNSGRGLVYLPDRFLRTTGSRFQASSGFGVAYADESASLLPSGNTIYFLSWAAEPTEIWCASRTGMLVRYSTVTKTAVGSVLVTGVENRGLWYSRKHGVFVGLYIDTDTDRAYTRVWAQTAVPVSLAAPTAGAAVTQGASVTLTTRLLGAASEPVPDEIVGWSVTGDATLLRQTSRTDAEGYATNTLLVALDASGDVEVDVEAQVS